MRVRLVLVLLSLLLALPARADTVVLESGREIEDVVVSRQDDQVVVINPWNSRHPDMTWEIPEKNRIPREKVARVIVADPPLVEVRRRSVVLGIDAAERMALVRLCEEHDLDEERRLLLARILSQDPTHEAALEAWGGEARWRSHLRSHPEADPAVRALERAYVAAADPADLEEALEALREAGSKRPLAALERARRSAARPRGLREKVPLTFESETAPGATYCLYVPRAYDPLVPTPLVVALHGGGRGGADSTIVTGSGEEAMNFYREESERWGWIIVCPTALAAPWSDPKNEPWIDALLAEMRLLYNVDETRIYLTGHSMGGFGTWHWGPKRAEVWAAIGPCAGGGGPAGVERAGLPVYVFHGTDDKIVPPDSDRAAVRSLARGRRPHDFVYTELDGVGHGFPASVRAELFRFFAGRRKDDGRRRAQEPVSSFDAKVRREEIVAFGDPRELPEPEADGGDLDDLIEALERGGGGAAEAATALGARKEARAARAVARVLRSRRSNADVRVHACAILGAMGLEDGVRPLEKALKDEDYRVVQAAVAALGRTGLAAAADGVAEGLGVLGERFEDSVQGDAIPFRAYEVRLEGLRVGVEAAGRLPFAPALDEAVAEKVVARVFLRETPLTIHGEQDPRFRLRPSTARLALARAWLAARDAWGRSDADDLPARVAEAWRERQPDLAALLEAGAR